MFAESAGGPVGRRTARPRVRPLRERSVERREPIRVLIAEDEFLVGIQLEEDLQSAGCSIVGPFSTLEAATRASRSERFDLAILDINLNGAKVYPLASELSTRGVPFIFLSGYVPAALPETFRESPHVAKPHDPAALLELVRAVVAKADQGA